MAKPKGQGVKKGSFKADMIGIVGRESDEPGTGYEDFEEVDSFAGPSEGGFNGCAGAQLAGQG